MKVRAEISPTEKGRIRVDFPYNPKAVALIREVPGRSFSEGRNGNDPHWNVPLDMTTCRELRELFGNGLTIGERLREWAWHVVNAEKALGTIAASDTADLPVLEARPEYAKALAAINSRPFQRVGVRFIADSPCPLEADQPGLGKTLQVVAGLAEARLDTGPMLVISTKTAMETVWEDELAKWQPHPSFVAKGTPKQRQAIIDEFVAARGPRWLVVNPAMLQPRSEWVLCNNHAGCVAAGLKVYAKDRRACAKSGAAQVCEETWVMPYPALLKVQWQAIVADEVHRSDFAITNAKSKTAQGIAMLPLAPEGKTVAITGTPLRGKAVQLFNLLKWLTQDTPFEGGYSSAWRWQERYVVSEPNPFATSGKTFTGRLRSDTEEELFRTLRPYVLRRTKGEVAKDLPAKVYVPVWCQMTVSQKKQYREFVKEGYVRTDDGTLHTADGVLAELTRARQMAVAPISEIRGSQATLDMTRSGKVEALLERLTDEAVFDDTLCEGEVAKAVVFSQWASVARDASKALNDRHPGVATLITGETPQDRRASLVRGFQQDDGPRIMVMTTTAGGVAITLDRADSVHFLDETWEPTDQEQAEDRAHRVSRPDRTDRPLTVYTYRSRGTVEEAVYEQGLDKAEMQRRVLDDRRTLLGPADHG